MTRGERNNNPLNIRKVKGQRWLGEVDNPEEREFCTFSDMSFGVRAARLILKRYFERGDNTLRKIIGRWAPASENDTQGYIRFVSQRTGIDPDMPMVWNDTESVNRVLSAMARMESGVRIEI